MVVTVCFKKKRNGTYRFCIDFRKLNKIIIKDSHPLPLIQVAIDTFNGSKIFPVLDLSSGYWQIPLSENAKSKTAYTTYSGLINFKYCLMI